MIEPICALIACAVAAAVAVVAYYRICHAAKFWRYADTLHRAAGRHIANERYICEVRATLDRAAGTGPAKPATAGRRRTVTQLDPGVEWHVEKGGA